MLGKSWRSKLERAKKRPRIQKHRRDQSSLPPEELPGLEVVRGRGDGGLLSGLTPAVSSLTLSGVPLAHVTADVRRIS